MATLNVVDDVDDVDDVVTIFLVPIMICEYASVRDWVVTGEYCFCGAAVQFSQLLPWQRRILKCTFNLECAREMSLKTPLTRVRVVLPILKELRQVLLELEREVSVVFKAKALEQLALIISELEVTKREGKEFFE